MQPPGPYGRDDDHDAGDGASTTIRPYMQQHTYAYPHLDHAPDGTRDGAFESTFRSQVDLRTGAIPPYAAASMPDAATAAAVLTASGGHNGTRIARKRRRLDGVSEDDQVAGALNLTGVNSAAHQLDQVAHVSTNYDPAAVDAAALGPGPSDAAPTAVGHVGQYNYPYSNNAADGSSTDYHNHLATASTALTDTSQWHPSVASHYPDLTSYQQQPYFYNHSADSNSVTTFPSSWHSSDVQPFDPSVTAADHSVQETTATATMPFFPPSQHSAMADSNNDVDDGASTLQVANFPDFESFAQHAIAQSRRSNQLRPRPDTIKRTSSVYFGDASMHLKIQSLPILDNLVSYLECSFR